MKESYSRAEVKALIRKVIQIQEERKQTKKRNLAIVVKQHGPEEATDTQVKM